MSGTQWSLYRQKLLRSLKDGQRQPGLEQPWHPWVDFSLRRAHAGGFYFYLFVCFNSRQELELRRRKLDFDRHSETFGGWSTLMGTLVHFGPLWITRTHQIFHMAGLSAHTVPGVSAEHPRAFFCLKEWVWSTV